MSRHRKYDPRKYRSFRYTCIYGVYLCSCQLQMALSLRPLGHIRGNFTHMTMMIHIFDADVSIDIAGVDFSFLDGWESTGKAKSWDMINIPRESDFYRESFLNYIFGLPTCQLTIPRGFPSGFSIFDVVTVVG